MIETHLDAAQSILYVHPKSALGQEDFAMLAEKVDPHIEAGGVLRGLIIDAPSFPGWESFGAMAAHLRFVRDHHRKVENIALVTDSALGNVAERLMSHLFSARIKHFPAAKREAAKAWILSRT